jgi:hypothetical protein
MASRGKKKTTMAKLNRESKLRERRAEKAHRKDERKRLAANPEEATDALSEEEGQDEESSLSTEESSLTPVEGGAG